MSYILDALRRADAERERGSVPSLHAQSVPAGTSEPRARREARPMVWVVAGLSLALVASVGWQFIGREPAKEAPPPRDTADAPAVNAPVAVASPTPAPMPRSTLPPVPAVRQAPAPAPAPPPAAATATTVTPSPVPATAAAPAPAASARLPTQDELPEDVRRQIPKFAVGGSIYSESAASRFLILNGQIFHENDKVMPELVLEQIKLKSAVLRYRNQRFTIAY